MCGHGLYGVGFRVYVTYTPPTLTGAGPPTNGEYQQGLQPVALNG